MTMPFGWQTFSWHNACLGYDKYHPSLFKKSLFTMVAKCLLAKMVFD
jgi:hypothetical protein